jgi:hypothetical protein
METRHFTGTWRVGLGLGLALGSLLGMAAPARADSSCLVPQVAVGSIDGLAKTQDADDRLSVLRPCTGKVKPKAVNPVEVLFGTSGGSSQRLRVRAGESLDERIASAIGPGNQLIDIWPDGSILSALGGWITGKPRRISGVSGFDGAGQNLPLKGDLAALPGTTLPLAPFGWAPDQPVTLTQGGKPMTLQPVQGRLALPVERLVPGELQLTQRGRPPARLNVLAEADLGELRKALQAIDAQGLEPAQRALMRSAALQQEQLLVNVVAEYMAGRAP